MKAGPRPQAVFITTPKDPDRISGTSRKETLRDGSRRTGFFKYRIPVRNRTDGLRGDFHDFDWYSHGLSRFQTSEAENSLEDPERRAKT